MSEEATAEQSASDSNGLAVDLAMEAARSDPSLHDEVAAFLADQRRMIADQLVRLFQSTPEPRNRFRPVLDDKDPHGVPPRSSRMETPSNTEEFLKFASEKIQLSEIGAFRTFCHGTGVNLT